ncbi:hypothetical protein YA0024_23180 [Pseudomonas syringae]|uniref:hypothetical protein n=1 Tax=Pseudomonas TaxID=286 RepID=UPI0010113CC6|nr:MULTISPECIES: hypothetical protein [Pseudomonas]MBI6666724.1 hypothetical protein [Pseudomonas syringae]MBI6678769.1 hypothetical protein [Pseudomonas syringae]MBI6839431.1 hypothetical protein [Pseudomonas syringae]
MTIALMLTVIKTADRQDADCREWLASNTDLRLRVESVSVLPAFFFVTRKLRLIANLFMAQKAPNADGPLALQERAPCIERKFPPQLPSFP